MPEPLITVTPSPDQLREHLPVSTVTLLALALAPCALVLLLLLHCLLLGYKVLRLARRRKGARHCSGSALTSTHSLSLPPASCSRSRKESRFSSAPELASSAQRRVHLLRSWRGGSAPVLLLQSSDSETECGHVVPPNSPEQLANPKERCPIPVRMMRRSSTMELELISLDKVHLEGEVISSIPQEASCFVASTSSSVAGPGLDSDFGASAGVSLRILSADSDRFPGATWASGLEWDYYDPSYVTQNHVPKHRHHAPPITLKQYWV
ncbi:protein huluwa [Hoplias malabaricus]|uniref:protein huluwa n=1 Tax=Hoplias malabaricus TaxID=27720 RepID=UPI0034619FE4